MESVSALRSLSTFDTLTDRQVVSTLTTIALFERAAIAKLVAILAVFDDRKLFLPLGFTSIFTYCTSRLGLSQDEAFLRIEAARLARTFPVVLEYLEKGAVNLSTLRLLGSHLTHENCVAMLDAASHQKRPEVELLIARLKPKPDVPSTIRKLPALPASFRPDRPAADSSGRAAGQGNGVPAPAAALSPTVPNGSQCVNHDAIPDLFSRPSEIPARRPILAPLSETSYRLQITLNQHSHDTLRELQALMRHSIPSGDAAAIVARALDLLLADVRRKKWGDVRAPRSKRSLKVSGRRIPARIQREV